MKVSVSLVASLGTILCATTQAFQQLSPSLLVQNTRILSSPVAHQEIRSSTSPRADGLCMSFYDETAKPPKDKLVLGYQVASVAYTVTVASLIYRHGLKNVDALYSATGPFMCAVLAYILGGAAEKDRLGSDTYKRLNAFALEYAIFGFGIALSNLAVKWKLPTTSYLFFGIANAFGMIPFYKGWKRGINYGQSLVKEVWEGTKNCAKGMFVSKNVNSRLYILGTLAFGVAKLISLIEIFSYSKGLPAAGARVARFAKLSVLTAIMYTLKDAADRYRLEGTTFIRLNFLVSLVSASWEAYLYKGSMGDPFVQVAGLISLFTAFNGVRSILIKREDARAEF